MLVVLRVVIGLFFAAVGAYKLTEPYQNFLYVIQNYQLFPTFSEEWIARTIPWVELLAGAFVAAGLWLKRGLQVLLVLIAGFLITVGQALMRRLPIDECGCFGDLITFTLPQILRFDAFLFLAVALLLWRVKSASRFSLDERFPS